MWYPFKIICFFDETSHILTEIYQKQPTTRPQNSKQVFYCHYYDYNNHNQARLHLAQVMKNRHLEKAYQAIITLHIMFNQMNELMKARQKLDKMLFTQAKRKYKNFKDIYASY